MKEPFVKVNPCEKFQSNYIYYINKNNIVLEKKNPVIMVFKVLQKITGKTANS